MSATYTYNGTGLTASPLYRARLLLGDRGLARDADNLPVWLLSDQEITSLTDMWGFAEGVAQCADALASQFAQEPDGYTDEGGVEVGWKARVKRWEDLAARLREGGIQTQALAPGTPRLAVTTGPSMEGYR
jgi:hypothetical protein